MACAKGDGMASNVCLQAGIGYIETISGRLMKMESTAFRTEHMRRFIDAKREKSK